MFIVTQSGTILNCDKMICMDLIPYNRNNTGVIKFKSEGYDFDRKQQRMSRFLFEINEFLVDRDF